MAVSRWSSRNGRCSVVVDEWPLKSRFYKRPFTNDQQMAIAKTTTVRGCSDVNKYNTSHILNIRQNKYRIQNNAEMLSVRFCLGGLPRSV